MFSMANLDRCGDNAVAEDVEIYFLSPGDTGRHDAQHVESQTEGNSINREGKHWVRVIKVHSVAKFRFHHYIIA
jgi:hypothetical protein